MIVVCPTKALQEDMVKDHCSVDQCAYSRTKMVEFGLDSLVINSDTYAEARKAGRDFLGVWNFRRVHEVPFLNWMRYSHQGLETKHR